MSPAHNVRVALNCETCGAQFSLPPCKMKNGWGRFCSKSCSMKSRRKRVSTDVQRICLYCSHEFTFTTYPSAIARGRGRFCSHSCEAKYRTGPLASGWNGGKHKDSTGRLKVYALGHPDARLDGGSYIYEYRIIAAQTIGRPLTADEIVHHVNGDPTDNSPANLIVMTPSEHSRLHADMKRTAKSTDAGDRICQTCGLAKPDEQMRPKRFLCKMCRNKAIVERRKERRCQA